MLIRTQNKKQIINFNNYNGVAISYKSECDFGVCAIYELREREIAQVEMGNYSSEEKAIKVLDMIQDCYKFKKHEETYHEGVYVYEPTFQMPQDSEVEV